MYEYTQEKGPAAESFDDYERRIMPEFVKLLESNPDEPEVQKFLERNPALVPGGRTPGVPSGLKRLHHSAAPSGD
jgi:hypothetical protein